MCGIFGIVAHNGRVPSEVLERGTQSLAHRGPDDAGTIVISDAEAGEIGLGNRRLAILDLSPLAHQPMHDARTGNWIVYNGEIYNFRQIRGELEQARENFVSQSDTEVVLKAYARWGEVCLTRFRGMFAFALWDARRRRLFIARDPMGIKPLYYAQTGQYFLFASEVRSLLGTGLVPRQIDQAGLINYLTFGSAYDPFTLVQGVHALPAGCVLIWERGTVHQSQYWDLVEGGVNPPQERKTFSTEDETARNLQPILEEAVRLQLVSDVPVGVFLSGGIDSSALVSILCRGGIRPSTFSIVFRETEFSEAQHSREVAAKFKTDHHEISISQADVLAGIPDALQAMDLPTMDGINTYFVSREARRAGVKVALSGLGGDEIFAGYSTFRTVPRMERFERLWNRMPRAVHRPLLEAFAAFFPHSGQNRKLAALARGNGRVLHPYFLSRMLFTPDERALLLPKMNEETERTARTSQELSFQRTGPLDAVNRVSYLESRCYMLNTLLRDTDFMSMSQGLEVRVPLIDHQLAKTVLRIRGALKVNGTPKKLLVDALAGSLPHKIVHRPKCGFTLPFERWLRQELRCEVEPVLDEKRVKEGPLGTLLNGAAVQQVWQQFLRGKISWSRPWSLYVLQRWCELHSVSA